jgi:hypothetical protein
LPCSKNCTSKIFAVMCCSRKFNLKDYAANTGECLL